MEMFSQHDDDRKNLIQSLAVMMMMVLMSLTCKSVKKCKKNDMQLNISSTISGLAVSVFEVQAPTQNLSEVGMDSGNCQTMPSNDCDVKLKREKGEIENLHATQY